MSEQAHIAVALREELLEKAWAPVLRVTRRQTGARLPEVAGLYSGGLEDAVERLARLFEAVADRPDLRLLLDDAIGRCSRCGREGSPLPEGYTKCGRCAERDRESDPGIGIEREGRSQ